MRNNVCTRFRNNVPKTEFKDSDHYFLILYNWVLTALFIYFMQQVRIFFQL